MSEEETPEPEFTPPSLAEAEAILDSAGDPDVIELAHALYEEYCGSVGGVAYNGDPLPSWPEFASDPEKETQVTAWRHVASVVESIFGVEGLTITEDHDTDSPWVNLASQTRALPIPGSGVVVRTPEGITFVPDTEVRDGSLISTPRRNRTNAR